MKYDDETTKLKHAMQLFQDAVDHTVDARDEAHRAERFYHNTACEGQWEPEDLAYLRDQYRPAMSFNVIKPKLDTFFGMYAEAQRAPIVVGSGDEDELLAKAINVVKDKLLKEADYESLAARQLKTGTITGECGMQIEVTPNPDGEGWIDINLYRVMPFELYWDISSLEPDRSDARYVFWNRWFDEFEFKSAYPEHADKWSTLKVTYSNFDEYGVGGDSDFNDGGEVQRDDFWNDDHDSYRSTTWNRYYYDRQKNKVRVIRYEYITEVERTYATDQQTGERRRVPDELRERLELAVSMGAPITLQTVKEEIVSVCEFLGGMILEEFEEAGPFEGFSIESYCYDVDEETGTAYGPIRNLFDPQMELNKSISLDIENLAQSTSPGTMAEEGAVDDTDAFRDAMREPGGVAIVKKGALTTGAVQDRQATPPSPAVAQRRASAMELLNEISGVPSTQLPAAEFQQSGVTVALRFHKQKQTVSTPFAHFEKAQRDLVSKVVQAIVNLMPEDQFNTILDAEGEFMLGNGMIVEFEPNPQGQGEMVPKKMAKMASMRDMKWSLDMEYATENNTVRMMELEMLMQLQAAGTPIDPTVMVDRATSSRSVREKLKAYIEKIEASGAAAQEAQAQAMEQQAQQFAQLEAGKQAEVTRHNMATEQQAAIDSERDTSVEAAKIWEKADEAEKARLMEMMQFAANMQARNEGVPANG
jgi:hypothetical protein